MSNQVEQLTRDIHAAFSNNELDKAVDLVRDDIVIHSYGHGMVVEGKEGFMGFMQVFKAAFPDVALSHTSIVSNGNTVAVEFTICGTHTGTMQTPAGPIPPSGKSIEINASEFLIWEDGKLASVHNYQDSATMMRQIGVM